jgi:hypothetical protein
MQCQNCGTIIMTGAKQCSACGDEVVSAFTSTLPQQATDTGPVDYSSLVNSTNPETLSKPPLESKLNGKPVESEPLASRPLPIPPGPATAPPFMSAAGRDFTAEVSRTETPTAPADLLRPRTTDCRRCGRELKVGAKFCSICGTSVEPSVFDRALSSSKSALKQGGIFLQSAFKQSSLPASTIVLFVLAGIFMLTAIIQYLIPIDVDAGSPTQVIFHLRSIEFLLVALIFIVASLVITKR